MTDANASEWPLLPPEISTQLKTLCDELVQSGGTNVSAVILYGGLARGRHRAGVSDVNLLLLLADPSIRELVKIAPTLHLAWRSMRAEPYIVGTAELARTAEDFPTRFWDIQRSHVTLFGVDPFTSLNIPPQAIRARIEQELRNLAIRLRRRFVFAHADPAAQQRALRSAAVPLAVALSALLQLRGKSTDAVFADAAAAFSLDAEVLRYLKELRGEDSVAANPQGMFDRVLATILQVAEVAAAKETR